MRWPWRRCPKADGGAALAARESAESKLDDATGLQQEINEVASELREIRRRNRFADMIMETMKPAPRPRDER